MKNKYSFKNINIFKPITRWWWPFSGTFIFGGNGQPRYTGRAIGSCALRLGIALWDPVDEVVIMIRSKRQNLYIF